MVTMLARNKRLTVAFASLILIFSVVLIEFCSNEEQKIIQQKQAKVFPIVSQFETDLFDIVQTLEVAAQQSAVVNVSAKNEVSADLHGIPEDKDMEKRDVAKMILFNKSIKAVFFTLPNADMYMIEPFETQKLVIASNFAFRDWYDGVMNSKSSYVGQVYHPLGVTEASFAIATPVKSETGEIVGILGVLVNLDSWNKLFAQINVNKNEDVVILDHNGNIVIDSKQRQFNSVVPYNNLNSVQKALLGNTGTETELVDGVKSFVVYAPITTTQHTWALIITESYDDVFSSVQLLMWQYVIIAAILCVIALLTIIKLRRDTSQNWLSKQNKIRQIEEYENHENKIQVIPSKRKSKKILYGGIAGVLVVSLVVFIIMENKPHEQNEDLKSAFVIQNLRGDTVDTWVNWRIPEGEQFHIHVVTSDELTDARLKIISDTIYSTETLEIDDSLTHKGPKGEVSTYYAGWAGAIGSISNMKTKFPIPVHFHSTVTENGDGDVLIRLSKLQNTDGYTGYTKSFIDNEDGQILKSTVTIYDVDDLSDNQLATIVRHELGHAFGLAHSTASEDLMAAQITTPYPYISKCDIDALVALYDGKSNSHIVCEK